MTMPKYEYVRKADQEAFGIRLASDESEFWWEIEDTHFNKPSFLEKIGDLLWVEGERYAQEHPDADLGKWKDLRWNELALENRGWVAGAKVKFSLQDYEYLVTITRAKIIPHRSGRRDGRVKCGVVIYWDPDKATKLPVAVRH